MECLKTDRLELLGGPVVKHPAEAVVFLEEAGGVGNARVDQHPKVFCFRFWIAALEVNGEQKVQHALFSVLPHRAPHERTTIGVDKAVPVDDASVLRQSFSMTVEARQFEHR